MRLTAPSQPKSEDTSKNGRTPELRKTFRKVIGCTEFLGLSRKVRVVEVLEFVDCCEHLARRLLQLLQPPALPVGDQLEDVGVAEDDVHDEKEAKGEDGDFGDGDNGSRQTKLGPET